MTTLENRDRTALLVIDMQVGVLADTLRRDEVLATVAALVGRARSEQVPVIWVQHASQELPESSAAWRIVPELRPEASEALVHKRYGDAFEGTALEAELARRSVGRVIVVGAQSDACIRATLHGAFVRGYDTVLVGDAHTTQDFSEHGLPPADLVVAHTNRVWTWQDGPGREASVVAAADVML